MKLFVPETIEQYAHDHTHPRPALFDELREHTLAEVPHPQMQVGRVEGTLLKLLATILEAERILEIGTYTGYSSLCMAEALPTEGVLITCDRSEEYTAVARRFWDKSPHGHKIRLELGDALESVRKLSDEPFDMAFIDADKARYPDYYDEILPRIRAGGLLVVDNVLWSGEVLAPESDDARGISALNDRVQHDDRVENVMLTVRDGILLARKR
jgi:caffeoyl-CoA O-methyltransferase